MLTVFVRNGAGYVFRYQESEAVTLIYVADKLLLWIGHIQVNNLCLPSALGAGQPYHSVSY